MELFLRPIYNLEKAPVRGHMYLSPVEKAEKIGKYMSKTAKMLFAGMIFLLLCGCTKDKPEKVSGPISPIKLSLSPDTLFTGKDKSVAVTIHIENSRQAKELLIRKSSDLNMTFKKVSGPQLGSSYDFSYTVTSEDEDVFDIIFNIIGIDGKAYDTKRLHIDNRTGLVPYSLRRIARVTGKSTLQEDLPNPNLTDQLYDVGGTDLGIMWEMGNGDIGIFFGDTFGRDFTPSPNGGPNGGNWRANVLAFSNDTDLNDGLSFSGMAMQGVSTTTAREIVYSPHITNGTGSHTAIPTAAIHANGAEYVHYMDIRRWGEAGRWETNFSELYTSADNGLNWVVCPQVRFAASSNFAQAAYAKKDGYVYMIGTPSGRFGNAYLARFREADILNKDQYEYWNGSRGWVKNDESAALPIFQGPVGEISLAYNTKHQRWIAAYLNEHRAEIVLREAKTITGFWSEEKQIVSSQDYPGLYGAFIHPLKNDGDDLYFLMSMWQPYNVFLMRSRLKMIE